MRSMAGQGCVGMRILSGVCDPLDVLLLLTGENCVRTGSLGLAADRGVRLRVPGVSILKRWGSRLVGA